MAFEGIILDGICKQFGDKVVLNNIDIQFKKGTIHSIVGENGAGKSTLMNIMSGVLQPTKGKISIDNQIQSFQNPNDAIDVGIGMVYQHFMLVPILSAWQNIILGYEPEKYGVIDQHKAIKRLEEIQIKYGLKVNLHKKVGLMTVGEQQRIEILKVLYRGADYIILDEPTAVLTPGEIEELLNNIIQLKQMGKTIIFISHKLEEVLTISDEITVIRTGEKIGTVSADATNKNELAAMMVGKDITFPKRSSSNNFGETVLKVQNIHTKAVGFRCSLNDISFNVKEGEIMGIAGVDGNGQLELLRTILGLDKPSKGSITFNNTKIDNISCSKIRKMGIGCIPPDRQKQGLILDLSILHNVILGCEHDKKLKKRIFMNQKKVKKVASTLIEEFDVRSAQLNKPIKSLSGGNQQKVILARECELRDSKLIIAVNPTRGLDIGAMDFVYRKLNAYKQARKSILLISTDLDEILRISDQIAVLYKGQIMDILENVSVEKEAIGMLMAGIKSTHTGVQW